MGLKSDWKKPFKRRLWSLAGILICVLAFAFLSSIVESYLERSRYSLSPEELSLYNPSSITILIYSLSIASVLLGILSFYWIPQDIVLNLCKTLITLGWNPVSRNFKGGLSKFRFKDWELAVAIHIYAPSSHQFGLVTLLLTHSKSNVMSDEYKRFFESGYIVNRALQGHITCHTTIPNLPWQVLRICSLIGVEDHTTAFS